MSASAHMEWEACVLEPHPDRALEREVRKAFGVVPPSIPYLTPCPWLVRDVYLSNFRNRGLAHLASPGLDAIESGIVPLARETVRYRSDDLQRRARKLREQLTVEQFLEFVGVVGLANSICRLSLVLCEA